MHSLKHLFKSCWLVASLLVCHGLQAQSGRLEFSGEDNFVQEQIQRGIRATKSQCESAKDATAWAQVREDLAECIKYWSSGLGADTGRAIVFLHGDFFPGTVSLPQLTGERLSSNARVWHRRLNAPYIFIGRPGTHGSSGEHARRRTLDEALLISNALDQIASRHGIREFVIAGQSGGGHMTSSLLTLRDDIVCAVPTSAPSSPRVRYRMMGRSRDTTNYDSYEPTEHLEGRRMHPALRVFILGDPSDSNVFWASQVALAEPLRRRAVETVVIEGTATGPQRHALNDSARYLAGLCYHDRPTDEVLRHLKANDIKG
jgi:pimeloyl-ACP methyl ester carboxylesterase